MWLRQEGPVGRHGGPTCSSFWFQAAQQVVQTQYNLIQAGEGFYKNVQMVVLRSSRTGSLNHCALECFLGLL